jgi:hypothetical protein
MNFDSLLRTFLERPALQRLFMAFTVGLFLSCAARVSDAQPQRGASGPTRVTASTEVAPPAYLAAALAPSTRR